MNRVVGITVAAILSIALAACGTTSTVTPARLAKPQTKVVVEWDGPGFGRFARLYEEEMIALMQRLAADKDYVLTAVLDGQPLTTAKITATNFASSLKEEGIEKREETEAKQAIAEGIVKTLIAHAKAIVPGSGELQGLELAANTPNVSEIYQWTDAVVNEPDGHFDLTSANNNQLAAEIAKWRPRLAGIRNKTVVVVGVGHGVGQAKTVERAHHLYRAVIEGNGGHLVWTQTLGQLAN